MQETVIFKQFILYFSTFKINFVLYCNENLWIWLVKAHIVAIKGTLETCIVQSAKSPKCHILPLQEGLVQISNSPVVAVHTRLRTMHMQKKLINIKH